MPPGGNLRVHYYYQSKRERQKMERCFICFISKDDPIVICLTETPSVAEWLQAKLSPGDVVGADSEVLSYDSWIAYEEKFKNITLKEVTTNLVDSVWTDIGGRPAESNNELLVLNMTFAGETWQDKVVRVRNEMANEEADGIVLTAMDDTAWLFNLRGSDVVYNPVFFSYTLIEKDKVSLYIKSVSKLLTNEVQVHLNTPESGICQDHSNCVNVIEYNKFFTDLQTLSMGVSSIWVSPMSSYRVFSVVSSNTEAFLETSIVRNMKSRKNPTEIEGLRRCHIRDSAAVIEFMTMIEKDVKSGSRTWTELSAAEELDALRARQLYNKGPSFASISASGPNGAIIHYRPTNTTDRAITTSDMYLLDSGGQYLDGTTDTTRTFHFGTPTDLEKEAYTRVLIGVIDLATAVWPNGTYGRDIDYISRRSLWNVGLDYLHGTGHGIGAFLHVHEGPGRINLGCRPHQGPLYGEMFFSDEPGYYEAGKFGIRLETIVMTKKVETKYTFTSRDSLGFEAFTLVPFEPNLINNDMLNNEHRQWLNDYHAQVQQKVAEEVLKAQGKSAAYDWVTARTAAIPLETCSVSGSKGISCQWCHLLIATIVVQLFHMFTKN